MHPVDPLVGLAGILPVTRHRVPLVDQLRPAERAQLIGRVDGLHHGDMPCREGRRALPDDAADERGRTGHDDQCRHGRGPARPQGEGWALFSMRRWVRWATPDEQRESISFSALLVILGFVLIVLGAIADTRHPII